MARTEEEYIPTEVLGSDEIQRRNAKKRYQNLSDEEKSRLELGFKKFFKIPEIIERALDLLKSGRATNESEAHEILQKIDFDDRLDQYH